MYIYMHKYIYFYIYDKLINPEERICFITDSSLLYSVYEIID